MLKSYAEDINSVDKKLMYSIKYCELRNIQNILETFLTESTQPEVKILYSKAVNKLDKVLEINSKL